LGEELMEIHKTIHNSPELSLQEFEASKLLCDFLSDEGFEVKQGISGIKTAFRADAGKDGKLPRPAIVVEYDALPEIGHACGHSIIAAAGVGAGVALHRAFPEFPVSVLGTPAEEIGMGKMPMIKAGAFKGIDFAMMVHPSSKRQLVRLMLGVVQRTFTFHGKPSHAAARPEGGINALDAVVMFYTSVSALRQQLPNDARVHMVITDGGKVPNIIPDRSQALCAIRALDLGTLAEVAKKVEDCARGAAKSTGAGLKIKKIRNIVMPLSLNTELTRVYEDHVKDLGLETFDGPEDKNIGSSDMGNLSQYVPSIHPYVPVSKPFEVFIHTREFEKAAGGKGGRNAVMEGAKLLSLTAHTVMKSPSIYKKIMDEFKTNKQKLPKGLK
jgi:amidohydrolase